MSHLFILKKKFLNFKDLLLIFFFLVLFFNSLNTANIEDVLKSLKYLLYLLILLFCLKIKFNKDHFPLIKKIFKIITLTLFVLFVDMLIQKIFGYNIFGYESLGCFFDSKVIENCRVSSFFGEEYVAGSFISKMVVIVSLYYLLIQKNILFYTYFNFEFHFNLFFRRKNGSRFFYKFY